MVENYSLSELSDWRTRENNYHWMGAEACATASLLVGASLLRWKVERIFWLVELGFRLDHWHQERALRVGRRLLLE